MREKQKNIVIVCSEQQLVVTNERTLRYPENGLMPCEQVDAARTIVNRWVRDGDPFVVATTSPYVLKAIEVAMDESGCGDDVVYIAPDGKEVKSTQHIFKLLALPLSKLLHGHSYEQPPEGEKDDD